MIHTPTASRLTPLDLGFKLFLLSSETANVFIDSIRVRIYLHHLQLRIANLRHSFVRLSAETL